MNGFPHDFGTLQDHHPTAAPVLPNGGGPSTALSPTMAAARGAPPAPHGALANGDTAPDHDDYNQLDDALIAQTLNADGTPKRPMNAFMIFARKRRPEISSANAAMRTGEISKILSKEWSSMPSEDKQFFQDKARVLKDHFNERYPDYVYRRRPNNTRRKRRSSERGTGADSQGSPDPPDLDALDHLDHRSSAESESPVESEEAVGRGYSYNPHAAGGLHHGSSHHHPHQGYSYGSASSSSSYYSHGRASDAGPYASALGAPPSSSAAGSYGSSSGADPLSSWSSERSLARSPYAIPPLSMGPSARFSRQPPSAGSSSGASSATPTAYTPASALDGHHRPWSTAPSSAGPHSAGNPFPTLTSPWHPPDAAGSPVSAPGGRDYGAYTNSGRHVPDDERGGGGGGGYPLMIGSNGTASGRAPSYSHETIPSNFSSSAPFRSEEDSHARGGGGGGGGGGGSNGYGGMMVGQGSSTSSTPTSTSAASAYTLAHTSAAHGHEQYPRAANLQRTLPPLQPYALGGAGAGPHSASSASSGGLYASGGSFWDRPSKME